MNPVSNLNLPLGMSHESKHWYTFGDTVVECISLQRESCVRHLCVAIKRIHREVFPTARLLVYQYSPECSKSADQLLDQHALLDDINSSMSEPLLIHVEVEKTRIWYHLVKKGCCVYLGSHLQTWIPAYNNVQDLRQQVASEQPEFVKFSAHLIVYRDQTDLQSPLPLDTIVFGLGQYYATELHIVMTDEPHDSPQFDEFDDEIETELSDLIEQLEWELNGLYTFKSAAKDFADMMDILLAKEGLEGVDWVVNRATRTGERRLGIDGPRYMVLEGSPLTRQSLDEVFTRNEWEVISLATWLLRGGGKEERKRRLTPKLVEAVATLLNKDLWH